VSATFINGWPSSARGAFLPPIAFFARPRRGQPAGALIRVSPESTFGAFRVALEVSHETGFVDTLSGAARLRRRMVDRMLTRCETTVDR
jgi:hypothetical protein